ncbi:MAG: hypothetical protein V1664_01315, partial [Candidatus Uhrbacteria bacterium]
MKRDRLIAILSIVELALTVVCFVAIWMVSNLREQLDVQTTETASLREDLKQTKGLLTAAYDENNADAADVAA